MKISNKIFRYAFVLLILVTVYKPVLAQHDERFEKELNSFIKFIRDSVLKNQKTLVVNNFLSNKGMFGGAVFFGETILTEEEFKYASNVIRMDTSKYYLSKKLLKKAIFIKDDSEVDYPVWRLSKPIFIREYEFAIFSYGTYESQKTFLYKKLGRKWIVKKLLGKIDNY